MDNENNDIVIIELDRPRELKLTHKVLKRYCAKTGSKLSQIEDAVDDYENMTTLIGEMLRAEDPDLTPEQCDDLMDMVPIGDLIRKCAHAIKVGFGGNDEKGDEKDDGKDDEETQETDVPFEK